MYDRYSATIKKRVEVIFDCDACGAHGHVCLRTVGRSGPVSGRVFVREDEEALEVARRGASKDLENDTERTLSLVACPTCGHRSGRAGPVLRVGRLVVITIVLAVISGGKGGNAFLGALLLGGFALYAAYLEYDCFARARAAEFITFAPGKPPRRPKQPAKDPRRAQMPAAGAVGGAPARLPTQVPSGGPYRTDPPPFFPPPPDRGPSV